MYCPLTKVEVTNQKKQQQQQQKQQEQPQSYLHSLIHSNPGSSHTGKFHVPQYTFHHFDTGLQEDIQTQLRRNRVRSNRFVYEHYLIVLHIARKTFNFTTLSNTSFRVRKIILEYLFPQNQDLRHLSSVTVLTNSSSKASILDAIYL